MLSKSCKCIQVSTTGLQVRVQDGRKSRETIVKLQQLVSLDEGWLYLIEVCPAGRFSEGECRLTCTISDTEDLPRVELLCR